MKKFVNSLTIIRLLATFILPMLWKVFNPIILIIVVALILLTDFFDGMLARHFHVQTLFGSILDTVADKFFGIVIVLLVARTEPLFYIVVGFEVLIALINLTAAFLGARTKSSIIGRFKMWVLGLATLFGIIVVFKDELASIITYEPLTNVLNEIIKNQDMLIVSTIFLTAGAELMVSIDYLRSVIKQLYSKKIEIKYEVKDRENLMKVLFDTAYYLENKNISLSKHLLK